MAHHFLLWNKKLKRVRRRSIIVSWKSVAWIATYHLCFIFNLIKADCQNKLRDTPFFQFRLREITSLYFSLLWATDLTNKDVVVAVFVVVIIIVAVKTFFWTHFTEQYGVKNVTVGCRRTATAKKVTFLQKVLPQGVTKTFLIHATPVL